MDELCEGIAFDIDDVRWDINKIPTDLVRLVRACSHLVLIDDETKVVQFAHCTVQQYNLLGVVLSYAMIAGQWTIFYKFMV